MLKKVLITVPKLSAPGGVSAFWNALLPELYKFKSIQVNTLEIGGHGKNIIGPLLDQRNFSRALSKDTDLFFLNPSLGFRSFFRDGLFARQLVKKGIPFVAFFHGWDLAFEEKVGQKYLRFFKATYGKATTLFVLSQKFANKLREWGYQGNVVIETTVVDATILNDFNIEQKYTSQNSKAKIRILFLSRLLKEKGVYETIDAFENIKRKFYNLELMIAGDGEAFKAVSDYIRHKDGISMCGHVVGKQKINLFTSSHIYCLPSYSEGLPTSVLEAMAFGLPIITTPVGGLQDFFKDGKMGYFVGVRNVSELQHSLERLISDYKLIEEIGRFNYKYAHDMLMNTAVSRRLTDYLIQSMNKERNG